ncbi:hypothetical protein EXIGLDRAFT_120670 [Exidia glandulosa HHB12029]|uniref:Uncharacterized protein n=1 Tax=Exidia glandulosa HHB12029 TaxID=1314781 RepID=A0A166ABM9_EXIGL|nr:hypothetical protein EXIGLDRAFT_120670 [Exidia glandulosa HHB12029]
MSDLADAHIEQTPKRRGAFSTAKLHMGSATVLGQVSMRKSCVFVPLPCGRGPGVDENSSSSRAPCRSGHADLGVAPGGPGRQPYTTAAVVEFEALQTSVYRTEIPFPIDLFAFSHLLACDASTVWIQRNHITSSLRIGRTFGARASRPLTTVLSNQSRLCPAFVRRPSRRTGRMHDDYRTTTDD